jgi:hypothetical protein
MLWAGAEVVVSGGVVAFDVVVGSADRGGLFDVGEGVVSGLSLVGADGGNAASPGGVTEPPCGAFRICSRSRWRAVRSVRPSVSPITGSCAWTRCNDALALSGLLFRNAVLASLSSVRTAAAVSTERA